MVQHRATSLVNPVLYNLLNNVDDVFKTNNLNVDQSFWVEKISILLFNALGEIIVPVVRYTFLTNYVNVGNILRFIQYGLGLLSCV